MYLWLGALPDLQLPPPATCSNPPLFSPLSPYLAGNVLVCGDNLDVLRELPDECVGLIYLNPPFNSNQFYVAAFGDKGRVAKQLSDIWRWSSGTERTYQRVREQKFKSAEHQRLLDCIEGIRLIAGQYSNMAAYIVYRGVRLFEMRRVLKRTGSIYLHCDPHANAYLRILMDAVFGDGNFCNEIAWCYRGGGVPKMDFARKHDTILRYSKTSRVTFDVDAVRIEYSEDSTERLQYKARSFRGSKTYDAYEPNPKGKHPEDWWPIQPIMPSSKERLGYPTQKPLALLERIIKASSRPGDLVLDPFCGCGTAADSAASLGRQYLGIDISAIAVRVMQQRLESRGDLAAPQVYGLQWSDDEWTAFERRAFLPRDESDDGIPGWAWAEDKVAALLNAIPNDVKTRDGGVDARYFGVMDTAQAKPIVIPIQVKTWREDRPVGRPELDKLLGVQTAMNNQGVHAPMSVMVSMYTPSESLRTFAAQQGR